MKQRRVALAAAMLAATFTMPGAVSADYLPTCPDQMVVIPAALVPEGDKKDHNRNGLICGKFEDGRVIGGPDEMLDDLTI